jgi:hypothetical protein
VLAAANDQVRVRSSGANRSEIIVDNQAGGNQSAIVFEDAGTPVWQLGKQTNNSFFAYDEANANLFLAVTTSGTLSLGEGGQIQILKGGNVGIGTGSPGSYQLYVNGSAYATGTWSTSDGRLKTHVATVTNGLALVEQLRPVRYDWLAADKRIVGKDLKLATDRPQIGFIAQEVEKVLPEAVTAPAKGGPETYSINEGALVPVLTAAIKEQQAEIEDLKAEVAALKVAPARTSAPAHHKHHR